MSTISFIIPSINRESLHRTIESIEVREGDEVLVEFDLPPTRRWGNDQRNKAMARATGEYLAFIDDDDQYVKGHRDIMERAIQENPNGLTLFKMQMPDGNVLWKYPEVFPGNVGTPMILVPNNKEFLHHWEDGRNMADQIFIKKWKGFIGWNENVIALIGHNYDPVKADKIHL